MLKADHACSPPLRALIFGPTDANACADACIRQHGCKYFLVDQNGYCWWDQTDDGSCPSGWTQIVGANYYEITGTDSS